ncbi:MAG: hypothetical protein FJX72_05665 [Armatimonadetes bacterium]|nr:hypothetical protein [Armatimonadota bacterium]
MRTTIELPDDLLRRAKATAALRGQKLKHLVAALIERGLDAPDVAPGARGNHAPLPEFACLRDRTIRATSNAQIERILMQEDLQHVDLDRSA